jgi:hypothetical protein
MSVYVDLNGLLGMISIYFSIILIFYTDINSGLIKDMQSVFDNNTDLVIIQQPNKKNVINELLTLYNTSVNLGKSISSEFNKLFISFKSSVTSNSIDLETSSNTLDNILKTLNTKNSLIQKRLEDIKSFNLTQQKIIKDNRDFIETLKASLIPINATLETQLSNITNRKLREIKNTLVAPEYDIINFLKNFPINNNLLLNHFPFGSLYFSNFSINSFFYYTKSLKQLTQNDYYLTSLNQNILLPYQVSFFNNKKYIIPTNQSNFSSFIPGAVGFAVENNQLFIHGLQQNMNDYKYLMKYDANNDQIEVVSCDSSNNIYNGFFISEYGIFNFPSFKVYTSSISPTNMNQMEILSDLSVKNTIFQNLKDDNIINMKFCLDSTFNHPASMNPFRNLYYFQVPFSKNLQLEIKLTSSKFSIINRDLQTPSIINHIIVLLIDNNNLLLISLNKKMYAISYYVKSLSSEFVLKTTFYDSFLKTSS